MIYNAEQLGMLPGEAVGRRLNEVLASFRETEGEKILEFPAGTYYISSDDIPEEKLYITNTIGMKEYHKDERPHIQKVAFDLQNLKDVTIKGDNAVFVLEGRMTNAIILNCENITFEGIEIKAENPDSHEFTIENIGNGYVDFRLDSESRYICKDGNYYFVGKDYETDFRINIVDWSYFGRISGDNHNRIVRDRQPFGLATSITEIEPYLFRAKYLSTARFRMGDIFCVYDVRRTNVGFFIEGSKNVTLRNIKQRFNISLAVVAQNTDTITITGCEFCPAEGQVKQFVSFADFIQVCMCKGQVTVTDNKFIGAGDDVLNVHGTHFKIVRIKGNTVTCRFMHHQSYGYLAFNEGDEVEFVSRRTLLAKGSAKVLSAKLENEYDVVLTLDNVKHAKKGQVIENITLCPDLYFARNYMARIVTRGLLITTRGKVVVEDNDFDNLIMPSILFSDDAKSWYESGPCRDVTIRNNRFGDNDGWYIQILPENRTCRNAVHGTFVIEGNTFEYDRGIDAQRCEKIVFRNNILKEKKNPAFVKCTNVTEKEISY